MRHFGLLILVVITCCSQRVQAAARVLVDADGTVQAAFQRGQNEVGRMVFRFGLPRIAATKRWRENGVLHTLWITNGIRYTQTVLITTYAPPQTAAVPNAGPNEVLLVSIEGENTNAEYAEAAAEVAVEVNATRQQLELKDGLILQPAGQGGPVLGALEIPDSGIKTRRGEVLEFAGNMPPSLKGSMTLKIPVQALKGEEAPDRLRDMDFQEALRRALRSRGGMPAGTGELLLDFSNEENNTEPGR